MRASADRGMMIILSGITASDMPIGLNYNQFDPVSVTPSQGLLKRLLNVDAEVANLEPKNQGKAVEMAIKAAGGMAKDVDEQMIESTVRSPAERQAMVEDMVKTSPLSHRSTWPI